MKKSLKFIILFLLIIPVWVKADMGAPTIKGYDAVITNPNGVNCEGTIIPYDTKIEVAFEWQDIDGYMANVSYSGSSCDISVDNIKPYNSVYNINEATKLEKTEKALVVSKSGVQLYNGPSTIYEKVGTIPYNTELKYNYVVGDGDIATSDAEHWLYVEYNNLKGWIETLTGDVAFDSNSKILTVEDAKFYNIDGQVVATIPKFTELKGLHKYNDYSDKDYYLTYNGIKGYLKNVVTGEKLESEQTIISKYSTKMYSEFYGGEESVIATIPKGTVLKYKYRYSHSVEFIYTSYDGKEGWVSAYALTYGDGTIDDEETNNEVTKPDNENQKPNENNKTEQTDDKKENNNVVEQSNKISIKDIVILCVGVAVVTALTTTVIILLVNKKGKKEENNNK